MQKIRRLPDSTSCHTKQRFALRLEAMIHAGMLNRRNGTHVYTYECHQCHGFHVTGKEQGTKPFVKDAVRMKERNR